MFRNSFLRSLPALLSVLAVSLVLAACSINVKKERDGEDKQVDIRTPIGGIHVSKGADPGDTGLPVYPGARLKADDSGGSDKSANVNISGFGYGLKVVALQYESDDAPGKLISYYRDQLRQYGNVVVCHSSSHFKVDSDMKDSHSSHELTCDSHGGENTELKVGTKENQRIVAIEPQGTGSSFALVYVRTHGKEAEI